MELLISKLINYGLANKMILEADIDYSVNLLLDLFDLDEFEYVSDYQDDMDIYQIIAKMLDWAIAKKLIEENTNAKDLFDTRIMNCLMPRPSEVVAKFESLYRQRPEWATDYFYELAVNSNYIRKNRTNKNIHFFQEYKYGKFEITINLSKPEKDPKEIAQAKNQKASGYPKCLLCKENVGFRGDLNRPARQNHRIVPVILNNQQYYLQYSPYVYYNEHCIVFNQNHVPMAINQNTFSSLLDFVKQFPHYMVGSNADLPIVGGSILTHDHFQGGRYHFPIEDAKIIKTFELSNYPGAKVEILNWPLTTIRITASSDKTVLDFALATLEHWKKYENKELDIVPFSGITRHNTITPIARVHEGEYQMDLVLRNNHQSTLYPDGIFHPHQNLHAIKKENIGLIEVMGLAVLPARLKDELELLKQCLLNQIDINEQEAVFKHINWYIEIKSKYPEIDESNIEKIIEKELTIKFANVLEDCGVFKMDDVGIGAFIEFVESLEV